MPAGHHPTSCKIEFPDALSTLPPLRQKFILASLPARLQFRLLAARDEDATGDLGQPKHGESLARLDRGTSPSHIRSQICLS